ncbi:hypothetical protein SS50377_24858 [Spironucleus salmonicida]|uniref:Uncharacterized protein n=1 Tax=Spironucleus salmonicida TaxID=348837 RepID=V6LWT5_9EUKA|nr:hypothetical protein SS50377_24858 [Spironucleus salmonicida]|eukprot:EST49112.1 Hypothetical protein SS50377_10597 [Spironucleus salmonicida]
MDNFEKSLTLSSESFDQLSYIKDLRHVLTEHQKRLISIQHKYASQPLRGTALQLSAVPGVLIAPLFALTEKLSWQIKRHEAQAREIHFLAQQQRLGFKQNLACVDLSQDVLRQSQALHLEIQTKLVGFLRQYAYTLRFSSQAFGKNVAQGGAEVIKLV